jgi:hypothetical protein
MENGHLEIKVSGKSKLYCPTEKGKKTHQPETQ